MYAIYMSTHDCVGKGTYRIGGTRYKVVCFDEMEDVVMKFKTKESAEKKLKELIRSFPNIDDSYWVDDYPLWEEK